MASPNNFFERQEKARGATRRLVFLFGLGVVGMVLACNAAAVLALAATSYYPSIPEALNDSWFWEQNWLVLAGVSAGVVGLVCVGSLFKSATLAGSGGGAVARSMGGTLVDPSTRDPLKRRLVNVVEEMAIASGMPVPEIYVMDQEPGINAFAAGSKPTNAAVAVTRGCLETLNRDELQGVIAHEFSHVANNDVKINTRIIGWLFGILMVAYLGQLLFRGGALIGSSGRRSREAGSIAIALFAAGLTFIVVGYIGLFFGRLIKASISRHRERLADASAVQYTRSADGIANALKKIGGYQHGSKFVNKNPENVSHMLFGAGSSSFKFQWFATHPPIEERIGLLDPDFTGEIATPNPTHQPHIEAGAQAAGFTGQSAGQNDLSELANQAGQVGRESLDHAHDVHGSLPESLLVAAHQANTSAALILALLIDADATDLVYQQLNDVKHHFGGQFSREVHELAQQATSASHEQKLPLLLIAIPSLRQLPSETQQALIDTSLKLIHADGKVDLFEFCLFELLSHHLLNQSAKMNRDDAIATLLSTLAFIEHTGEEQAQAFAAGAQHAFKTAPAYTAPQQWMTDLHHAMPRLAKLSPKDKQQVIAGVLAVIQFDGVISNQEAELLRLICGIMDVPMPYLSDSP